MCDRMPSGRTFRLCCRYLLVLLLRCLVLVLLACSSIMRAASDAVASWIRRMLAGQAVSEVSSPRCHGVSGRGSKGEL